MLPRFRRRVTPPDRQNLVIENLIDEARHANAFGLLMSLTMLIEFGDAFDYTSADFAGWCRQEGFREIQILPLTGPTKTAKHKRKNERRLLRVLGRFV